MPFLYNFAMPYGRTFLLPRSAIYDPFVKEAGLFTSRWECFMKTAQIILAIIKNEGEKQELIAMKEAAAYFATALAITAI